MFDLGIFIIIIIIIIIRDKNRRLHHNTHDARVIRLSNHEIRFQFGTEYGKISSDEVILSLDENSYY